MSKKKSKPRVLNRAPMLPQPSRIVRRTTEDRKASMWLETFNPIRNLTVSQAQQIFDCARRGNDVRLQWLYANIEQADPTLMICAERRAGALVDLDWTVRPKAARRVRGYDEGLADEQAACLESAYGDAEDVNLFPAIEHLASAFFRGHAHVAPMWSTDGCGLKGFELFDAWNFARDLAAGRWLWNPEASETVDASVLEPVPPGEVVTLVRSRHIDYPAMAIYLRSALGEKAWGQFLERYGVPPVIITMPPDVDPGNRDEYMEAAAKVADGACGALPNGSNVFYATEARGTNPFSEFLKHQQELVVLMATGGLLTSLTGATGIGQGATEAHEDTWRRIVRRDASAIATVLNRTVSDALLDRCFPGQPHLAQFDFETEPQPGAGEVLDHAAKAVAAGYRITKEELEERTGYTLEDAPQASGMPAEGGGGLPFFNKAPVAGEAERPVTKEIAALATALKLDFGPVAEAVQAFLKDPTPEAAVALKDRLPLLLPEDPQSALLLEQALAEMTVEAQGATVANNKPTYNPNQPRDNKGQFAQTPGAGSKEPETKGTDRFGSVDTQVLAANPKRNEERARAVLKSVEASKKGVQKMCYREELGWIGIEWGDPGNPHPDANGTTHKGGHGYSHIKAKHPNDIPYLPQVMAYGEIHVHKHNKKKACLVYKGRVVIVERAGKGKETTVTGYEPSAKAIQDFSETPLIQKR